MSFFRYSQDNAKIRHKLAALGGLCALPRKERRTYGLRRTADGSFCRAMVEVAAELEGSYEDFQRRVTQAAEKGMRLAGENFERLNPGGASFLKKANAFENPYVYRQPAGITYVDDGPVPVIEPTGEVVVDAGVLEALKKEAEDEGPHGGEGDLGDADKEIVDGVAENEGGEEAEQGGARPERRREWPHYLSRTGEPEKVHLQRALHLLQPKVERPKKERSRCYIAPNYLPGYRPLDPEHNLVRFHVYAFKNNQGLHGRCFSLGYLADIIVDGDAGNHSAAKKKAGVQVVFSPFLMQLPVNEGAWQYRRGERTLRPRVACTTVIMEVEGEEVEREEVKVFQLTAECKVELEQKGYRPREVKDLRELQGEEPGVQFEEPGRVGKAEIVAAEEAEALEVAELEAEGRFVVEKILDKRLKRNGEIEYLVKWENYSEENNEWVLVTDLLDKENSEVFDMVRAFEDQLLAAGQSRAGRERRPNRNLQDFV
jgi:hypothetical protein